MSSTDFFFVPCDLWTTNAERRMHYHERAERVGAVRGHTKLLARAGGGGSPWEVPVKITVRPRQKRGPLADPGSHLPTVKAIVDGLVDAGVLKDDTPEFVTAIEFLAPVLAEKGQNTGVYVAIKEA